MCNGRSFPAWQAESIRKLIEVPEVRIELLVVRGRPLGGEPGRYARLRDLPHLLWTLYVKGYLERRSVASRRIDLTEALAGVDEIECRPIPVGAYGEAFSDADLAIIGAHRLDVILRFGFGILKGEVLKTAKFGVWSYHHGDERRFRGQPPAFWEMVEDEPVVGSILQRLTDRLDGGIVLHRGLFKTTPHSYGRTRDDVLLGSADWVSVAARQILSGDTSMIDGGPSLTEAPIRRAPANREMLRFFGRQARRFLGSQWRGVTRASKWTVGVAGCPIQDLVDGELPPIDWVAEHGSSRYLADPFAIDTDAGLVVLVEDYDYREHRGVISALTGDLSLPRVVLDAGVHASYPYSFECDGTVYCVPETYQAEEVRLYRAIDFPWSWEPIGTLIDGLAALDPTIVEYQGRWWLFCTIHGRDSNTKLHIYHAPHPTGPWQPHLLNPVKTDVRSSRPAGTPFWHREALHRPTQDCSTSYGGAVTITRIDELTPSRFSESVVGTVAPPSTGAYRHGVHTLSAAGSRTLVDGRRDTFIGASFRRELLSRWHRIARHRSRNR